jgi:hypothetical protein
MAANPDSLPTRLAGGAIFGIAVATASARRGFALETVERPRQFGEIGTGTPFRPNGDGAHATLRRLPRGACMGMECAVTPGKVLCVDDNVVAKACTPYGHLRACSDGAMLGLRGPQGRPRSGRLNRIHRSPP